ncbi:acyl-CoA reductase [Actinoplanes sp. CA-054009]
MTTIRYRFGAEGDLTAPSADRLAVGDPRVVDFLGKLARKLLVPAVARRHPELGSLGFFLRPAELHRVVKHMQHEDALVFPRGNVFHVPPANVDTIFVYSWALSALAGNHNVVRISERSATAADTILGALNEVLADSDPIIGRTQRMVTYGRDDAITGALSKWADLRVIWGGDNTVEAIRKHHLRPSARDLTFPDRTSWAALSAAGWRAADDKRKREGVLGFTNDAYWFDQAACSSPRTVFIVGEDTADVREEFIELLIEISGQRGWEIDAAMAVEKRVNAYGLAATGAISSMEFPANSVTAMSLATVPDAPRRWIGAGAFPFAEVSSLLDLVPAMNRQDQTFSHFGFGADELREFGQALAGRGVDRIVPFGQALTFGSIWDGYDLPREFTRLTTLSL